MRMIVATVIIGNDLTSHEYWKFFISLNLDNTGITVIKLNNMEDNKKEYADVSTWGLITWNDHAHLGLVK